MTFSDIQLLTLTMDDHIPCFFTTPVRNMKSLIPIDKLNDSLIMQNGTWKGIINEDNNNNQFSYNPTTTSSMSSLHQQRSFLSSRMHSSQSAWDNEDEELVRRSISRAQTSLTTTFTGRSITSSFTSSAKSSRDKYNQHNNQKEIDGYLNKIQQCMRSQTLRSRQLGISQSSRLFSRKPIRTRSHSSTSSMSTSKLLPNNKLYHHSLLTLDRVEKFSPRTPSYLSKTKMRRKSELDKLTQHLNRTVSSRTNSKQDVRRHHLSRNLSTAGSTFSIQSATSGISEFAFDSIIGDSNVTNAKNRHQTKYMARLEPLRDSNINGRGSSIVHGWDNPGSNSNIDHRNRNNHHRGQQEQYDSRWNQEHGSGIVLEQAKTFITRKWQSEQELSGHGPSELYNDQTEISTNETNRKIAVRSLLETSNVKNGDEWETPETTLENQTTSAITESSATTTPIVTSNVTLTNVTSNVIPNVTSMTPSNTVHVGEKVLPSPELLIDVQNNEKNISISSPSVLKTKQTWRQKMEKEYGSPTLAGEQEHVRRRRSSLHSPTQKEVEAWIEKATVMSVIENPNVEEEEEEKEDVFDYDDDDGGGTLKVTLSSDNVNQIDDMNVINTINNTDTVNGCNGMVGDDISERLSVTFDEINDNRNKKGNKKVQTKRKKKMETQQNKTNLSNSNSNSNAVEEKKKVHGLISVKSFDSTVRIHRPSQTAESILASLASLHQKNNKNKIVEIQKTTNINETSNEITNEVTNNVGNDPVMNAALQHQVLCHQLLVMMRDACERSTSNDFLNVFSACDSQGNGTLNVSSLRIGLCRLGFKVDQKVVSEQKI